MIGGIRGWLAWGLVAGLAAAGCAEEADGDRGGPRVVDDDGGARGRSDVGGTPGRDAAPSADAGPDGATPADAAFPEDGAAPADAAPPDDGGAPTDAAAPTDGATPPDGAPVDCRVDEDCPSDDPCRASRCEQGLCRFDPVPDCCNDDADCGPGDACVEVHCDRVVNRCVVEPIPGCCVDDGECAIDAVCAEGFCDPESARCAVQAIPDCCRDDADCPAPDGCTTYACVPDTGRCEARVVPGCCARDLDCADGQACVEMTCRPLAEVDRDADGAAADVDCDDRDPSRAPGRDEICDDGVDGDCDDRADADDPDCAPPPPAIEYAAIQHPLEPISLCADEGTPLIFGRVYVAGRTPGEGPGDGIEAKLGYGPDGSDPAAAGWTWVAGVYNGDLRNDLGELNDDEYRAELAGVPPGEWDVAWRFRVDGGAWVYADRRPQGTLDGYDAAASLALTVRADCDGDGAPAGEDCDDRDPARAPGRDEICDDGVDGDCDELADADDPDCGPAPPPVGFAAIQHPLEPVTICAGQETPPIFGRVWVDGRTPGAGQGAGVEAELGYGPDGSAPDGNDAWRWVPGMYNGDLNNDFGQLNDDEYRAVLAGVGAGTWDVAWRFRVDGGPWTYADRRPAGSTDGYAPADALPLTVRGDCEP